MRREFGASEVSKVTEPASVPAPDSPPASDGVAAVERISAGDAATLAGLPALFAIAWLVPERLWPAVARAGAPFYARMLSSRPRRELAARVAAVAGARALPMSAERIVGALAEEDLRSMIELLREHRPGGWRPALTLKGGEHIDAALDRGQGAILWIGHFVHGELAAKMALHRFGYGVHHLSHPRHGFSATRFGMRYLNPIRTRIEDRYISRRVTLSLSSSAGALRTLETLLRENRVVSITVRGTARRPCEVPFLDGTLTIALGAPNLAHDTRAALLPVLPLRDRAGGFTIHVEAPLAVPPELPRHQAASAAAREYAARLERHVLTHPEQWVGWLHL